MKTRKVVIVSPVLADANNGNWQTARRWQILLAKPTGQVRHSVRSVREWPDGPLAVQDEVMLALHARRSAASIQAWSQARGGRGLGVGRGVLGGEREALAVSVAGGEGPAAAE